MFIINNPKIEKRLNYLKEKFNFEISLIRNKEEKEEFTKRYTVYIFDELKKLYPKYKGELPIIVELHNEFFYFDPNLNIEEMKNNILNFIFNYLNSKD